MYSKTSEALRWLGYLVLAIWVVNGIFVMFLLGRIDTIVHSDLYNHGLQFSVEWANPYWESIQLIYGLLGLPMILSMLVLVAMVIRSRNRSSNNAKLEAESGTEPDESEPRKNEFENASPFSVGEEVSTDQKSSKMGSLREPLLVEPGADADVKKANDATNWCPNCGKVFSKPMVMLDFVGGKTRLVNVCPYCSHVLGEALG